MTNPIIKEPWPSSGMGWSVIGEEEKQAALDALSRPETLFRYVHGADSACARLERKLEAYTGAKHALFVNSGTSALICCLAAWQVGPGDEVIVPAYTYIATASAVMAVGAIPVVAEIDDSLGLDPADVERKITQYTKAVILVHMQGVPGRKDAVRGVAKKHGLVFIEDCCQAIGARYRGELCGFGSHAFAWSTNYYKVITCGEGGVFFTGDDTAFVRGVCEHDPGSPMWNSELYAPEYVPPFSRNGFRGNEILAPILEVQLSKLEGMLKHTRALKKRLVSQLEPRNYAIQHVDDPDGDCGISFTMIAKDKAAAKLMAEGLTSEGLPIGSIYNAGFPDRHIYSYWTAVMEKNSPTPAGFPWKNPAYKGSVQYAPGMCPQTLDILGRSLRLTFHMGLMEEHIDKAVEAINAVDKRI